MGWDGLVYDLGNATVITFKERRGEERRGVDRVR